MGNDHGLLYRVMYQLLVLIVLGIFGNFPMYSYIVSSNGIAFKIRSKNKYTEEATGRCMTCSPLEHYAANIELSY